MTQVQPNTTAIESTATHDAGGVFVPRNGGFEARIGRAHACFDAARGGTMRVLSNALPQGDTVATVATVDMVFDVDSNGGSQTIRQSNDRSPQVFFLEEGHVRLGLRVLFKLYDGRDQYRGFGMTETWLYPDGQIFITAAATFENAGLEQHVTAARVEIAGDSIAATDGPPQSRAFAPSQCVVADAGGTQLAAYWRSGAMEHDTYVRRRSFGETSAPYYYRWPDYHNQAHGSGMPIETVTVERGRIAMHFATGTPDAVRKLGVRQAAFDALFRLAVIDDASQASRHPDADTQPAAVAVTSGGMIHEAGDKLSGYNDQEGCYEVRKTGGEPVVVALPADATGRTICVKAVALTGHGAVTATLDGKPLLPQLTTDGGIADDPLAPIREDPEAPADAALVSVTLTDRPQTLVFDESEGIQLTYQTRDRRRNFMVFSSHTGPRWSGLTFSPVDGRGRNMRSYGQREWALTDNLLHWFSFCGFTPEQMLDQLRDFTVLENGPDRVVFRYVSHNATDTAESQFVVTIPHNPTAMRMQVSATFRVLESWPYDGSQFFDVFPFRGVRTEDWWYPHVLWLLPDGRYKTMDTVASTQDGDKSISRIEGEGFFALHSSDRGNMLMLTHKFEPVLPTDYVICGNYIDYHMDIKFADGQGGFAPPPKGFEVSCAYDLALWGDGSLTRDALIAIGKDSLAAGELVLPDTPS